MLHDCVRAQALASDEGQFLREICAIALRSGGYAGAWVGFA